MDLENATPYAALAYIVVDKEGQEFHVVVARGTYELRPAPAGSACTHVAALTRGDLCFTDAYHGEMNRSSVKWESDLAPMKPRCDVIVVGAAHSPTGEPVPRIEVALRIERGREIPMFAQPGVLLEHRLAVHGPRSFERRDAGWELTEAEPFTELPLRYEHAFGGELKVYGDDDAACRLEDDQRLSEEVRRGHPEGASAPVAHATCVLNPVGTGFLEKCTPTRPRWSAGRRRPSRAPKRGSPPRSSRAWSTGSCIRATCRSSAPAAWVSLRSHGSRASPSPEPSTRAGSPTAGRTCLRTSILPTGMARTPPCSAIASTAAR